MQDLLRGPSSNLVVISSTTPTPTKTPKLLQREEKIASSAEKSRASSRLVTDRTEMSQVNSRTTTDKTEVNSRRKAATTDRTETSRGKKIKWTRSVDVIKILQQKITSRQSTVLNWLREADPVKTSDIVSRYGFSRVLEDRLHLFVEPSEVRKIWKNAVDNCYAVEKKGEECDVYEFLNSLMMLRQSRLSSIISSKSDMSSLHNEDDELGLFKNSQRRNERMNRIHRKHESLQTFVRSDEAMRMLWSQLSTRQNQINRIFHDIANDKGCLNQEQMFLLLKRLNIHIEKESLKHIWTKRLGIEKGVNEIDFHTFRSKLRSLFSFSSSSSSNDLDNNFFCGASSYDRGSSKRNKSRELLSNGDDALEQLRDRVMTQERTVIRVFRAYDTDRCGTLNKETFRKALDRSFHVKMRPDEFAKLWSRISSTPRVVEYRTLITRLRRGSAFETHRVITTTSETKTSSSSSEDITAKQVLQELKSRDLRSNKVIQKHLEDKTPIRPIDLELIIESLNLEGKHLRSGAFRSVWRSLDRCGVGKIDVDSLL